MIHNNLSRYIALISGFLLVLLAASVRAAPAALNEFGGPIYAGKPALGVTAALVKAGGGADDFSTARALTAMLGAKTVKAEVDKLTKQYGAKRVHEWLTGFDFAVKDALHHATAAGVKLPAPASELQGTKLAATLVTAGTAPDGVFWAGLLYDKALSHDIHNQVMADIDAKFGTATDANVHTITNQAFYDVAQALGHKKVKLAPLH